MPATSFVCTVVYSLCAAAKKFFAKIEEETATAIDAVFENKGKSRMYNLSGMAVGDDYHGIVIVDGKKVVR